MKIETSKNRIENEPDVIRVQEFAAQLRISVWTARQWAYRGKISSVKAGKHLLIPACEVERLIAENIRPGLIDGDRNHAAGSLVA